MDGSKVPSDLIPGETISLVKIITYVALGAVIGTTGFLIVYFSVLGGMERETDAVLQSGRIKSSTLSQDSTLVPKDRFAAQLTDPNLQHNTVQRLVFVYSYVATLPEHDLIGELNRTTDASWSLTTRVRKALQTALLERLVVNAPHVALEFALEQSRSLRTELVKTVCTEWASTDLDATLTQTKNLDEVLRAVALEGIIEARTDLRLKRLQEIGRELNLESHVVSHYIESLNMEQIKDPKTRWYELVAVPEAESVLGYEVVSRIAYMWYQEEGINVLEEILSAEAGERFQRNSINLILEFIALEDPTLAFQYAQDIPQEGVFLNFPPSLRVVSVWAQMDPVAALEAVQEIEPSGIRERLQNSAVSAWASTNPRQLLKNLEIIPEYSKLTAVNRSFSNLAQSSPNEASDLVLRLKDPEMRANAAGALVYRWSQDDVNATLAWVLDYPKTEPIRTRLFSTVLSMMADSDPKRAVQIASEQPIPVGQQVGLEAQLVSSLAFSDIDTALELLPKVRDGETKSAVYRTVGVSLVANGEAQKALSLAQQLPDTANDRFYRAIAYEWAKFDPPAVLTALKEFPTAEIRSSVARELSRLHVQNFSDGELEILKQYIIEENSDASEE